MNYRVLIADDEEHILNNYERALRNHLDIEATMTQSVSEALRLFRGNPFEYAVVLLDYEFLGQEKNGADVAEEILKINPKQLVIINSGLEDQECAIKCLRAGVADFVRKSIDIDKAIESLRGYFRKYDETRRILTADTNKKAKAFEFSEAIRQLGMVGQSQAMADVASKIIRLGKLGSDETFLIRGESGTGKELIAKAVHRLSHRAGQKFLPINCGAIPPNLLESELFGHEKGAFTGAISKKLGKFQLAHGGTIFLDEIGDMPKDLQVKLLRVLQEGAVEPVGANKPIHVDVRIIAATHVDLEGAIKEKQFREDLFYRLNVISVDIPPLRDRPEDIEPLILHFLEKHPRGNGKIFLYKAVQYLKNHPWRGNVRELENTISGILAVLESSEITPDHLPKQFFDSAPSDLQSHNTDYPSLKKGLSRYVDEIERQFVLSKVGGARSLRDAALKMSMSKSTLERKLKSWGYELTEVFNGEVASQN